jgi:capsular polysaccharide biosynthesis protein
MQKFKLIKKEKFLIKKPNNKYCYLKFFNKICKNRNIDNTYIYRLNKNYYLFGEWIFQKFYKLSNKYFYTDEKIKDYLFFFFSILKNFNLLYNKEKKISEGVLVHNRQSKGYYHWLLETLPKILFLRTSSYKNIPIILPYNFKKILYIKFFINLLKLNVIFIDEKKLYKIENIFYLPYISNPGLFRKFIRLKINKIFKKNQKIHSQMVYLSRKFTTRRFIVNENKIIEFFKKNNFKIIYPEKVSYQKQIKIFQNCNFLVSAHGGGLSNMIWMPKNARVLEIRSGNDSHNNCYFNLSSLCDLKYFYFVAQNTNISVKTGNLVIDIVKLEKYMLENNLL